MKVRRCLEDLLERGRHDWIQAAELASVARTTGGATADEEVRNVSLQVLRELLSRGLMEIGEVTESGFVRWNLSTDQATERVETEWQALPKGPDLGEVCWLNLTEKGAEEAQRVLTERGTR